MIIRASLLMVACHLFKTNLAISFFPHYNILIFSALGSKMKQIQTFIKRNTWITLFFAVSVVIIVSYILTMDLPELFDGAEEWYNLFFQLSIGYIINFMFYITQVYIPNNKRDKKVKECISLRLSQLVRDMDASLLQLAAVYAKGHSGNEYTKDELDLLLKLRFSDEVNVLNASKSTTSNPVHFTVREWIFKCITDVEKDIDNLLKYYAPEISVDLMDILEKIPRSVYHSAMPVLLVSPEEIDFSDPNENFFVEYYYLMQQLKEVRARDYC